MSRISPFRGAAALSLHSNASSPGEEAVGGLFSDFGAVRTVSVRAGAPHKKRTGAALEDGSIAQDRESIIGHGDTAPEQLTRIVGLTQLSVTGRVCVGGALRRAVQLAVVGSGQDA